MSDVRNASLPTSKLRPNILVAAILVILGLPLSYAAWLHSLPTSIRFAVPINQNDDDSKRFWPASLGWPGTDFLPMIWDLYKAEGLDFSPVYAVGGKGALATVLDDKADLGIVALAAVVDSIARGSPLVILAITTRSSAQVRLIARRESASNWIYGPIGYSRGTILESALLTNLQVMNKLDLHRDKKLNLIPFNNPKNVIAALLEGRIQSASILRPFADFALKQSAPDMPSPFVDVTSSPAYELNVCLVTTLRHWQKNREGILKAMTAIRRSREIARKEPARALEAIREFEAAGPIGMTTQSHAWKIEDLVLLTRPNEIRPSLVREAELRKAAGLLDEVPDFSNALSLLDQVSDALAKH